MTAAPGPQQPDEVRPMNLGNLDQPMPPETLRERMAADARLWKLAFAEGKRAAQPEEDPCEDGCDPAFIQQDTADSDLCSRCGRRGVMGDD